MVTQDVILFCQQQLSARVAGYGYDVYKLILNSEGKSYNAELTSPDEGTRTIRLTLFESALTETYDKGELSESIVRNVDDALRHLRK